VRGPGNQNLVGSHRRCQACGFRSIGPDTTKNFSPQTGAGANTQRMREAESLLATMRSTVKSHRVVAKSACCVKRMIGTCGNSFFNSRDAVAPSISGIDKSKIISPGRNLFASATVSAPLAAWAQISYPASSSSIRQMRRRIIGLSSATSTLFGIRRPYGEAGTPDHAFDSDS
jgi:hypothetical protein